MNRRPLQPRTPGNSVTLIWSAGVPGGGGLASCSAVLQCVDACVDVIERPHITRGAASEDESEECAIRFRGIAGGAALPRPSVRNGLRTVRVRAPDLRAH